MSRYGEMNNNLFGFTRNKSSFLFQNKNHTQWPNSHESINALTFKSLNKTHCSLLKNFEPMK